MKERRFEQLNINEKEMKRMLEGDDWKFPSDIKLVDRLEEAFVERAREAGWPEDDVYKMGMGFREALANAIHHGNKDDLSKEFEVKLKIGSKEIVIKVKDQGEGFKVEEVPSPLEGEGLLKENGRGVFMIREFFDEVEYNEKGNEVTLVRRRVEKGSK